VVQVFHITKKVYRDRITRGGLIILLGQKVGGTNMKHLGNKGRDQKKEGTKEGMSS